MRLLQSAAALLAACGGLAAAAVAQHPLVEIEVAGNARLPAAGVIAASGLRKGQTVTRTQLKAAAQKLIDTGFFTSVNYRYIPKGAGYALTFQVAEQPAGPIVLDIPGRDAVRLWQELKSADALVDSQMPDNERALAYYKRVIEAALAKSNHPDEVVLRTEADLNTGKTMVICRPAHLPKIAAIHFEGNRAIAEGPLQDAMAKVALGQGYSERDFRRMLELNLRPLYDELGRLTATFPRVSMSGAGNAAVTVTAGIDEGPVWRLGKVVLTGEALPLADLVEAGHFAYGAPANWKQFSRSIETMEDVLRRDGYIQVSPKPVRSFHDASQTVDVNVEVAKGPQFLFGELHIEGLDPSTQQRLAALWTLQRGAPMNQLYANEFIRSAMPVLRGRFKSVTQQLQVRQGTKVVDVTFKFK